MPKQKIILPYEVGQGFPTVDNIRKLRGNKNKLEDIRHIIITEINTPELQANKLPWWFWLFIGLSLVFIIVGIAAFAISPFNYVFLVLGCIGVLVVSFLFCARFGKKRSFAEKGMKILDARYGKEMDILKVFENKDEHGEVKVLRSLIFISKEKKKKKKNVDRTNTEDGRYGNGDGYGDGDGDSGIFMDEEVRPISKKQMNNVYASRDDRREEPERRKSKTKIKQHDFKPKKSKPPKSEQPTQKHPNPSDHDYQNSLKKSKSRKRTRRYGEKIQDPLPAQKPKNHYYSNSIDENLDINQNLPENTLRIQQSNISDLVPNDNKYEIKNSQDFHGEVSPQNFYNPSLGDEQIQSYEQYERKISHPRQANPYDAAPVQGNDPFDQGVGSGRLDTIEVDLKNFGKGLKKSGMRDRGSRD